MADVAAALKDWSATASSNSPTDSTTIGAGLADNLQQIQATIRQDLASKGADIASASTTDLGAVSGLMHDITGTTTITSFGTVASGIWKLLKFEDALTLTHNATSLILPGGANITTANGDTALMFSEGSGNWRCMQYQRASGSSVSDGTIPAQGRLTLTSGTAVTTSDVTAATTIYFAPYQGNKVELYNGTSWVTQTFTELSQATTDSTKSPAAVANDSNYDLFVWNDSGTLRCTRGPAWTSDTARGTGAGTTELEVLEGRYVNKIAITNGPAAQRGLYVGTIRSDGSAQINDSLAKRHVWNNYNRVIRAMKVIETTDSWTYTTATIRQANGSAANQLDIVRGLDEDSVSAEAVGAPGNSGGAVIALTGIGLDSTTAVTAGVWGVPVTQVAGIQANTWFRYYGLPGIGRHYLAWLEYSAASGTTTWYGDNGTPTLFQSGITGEVLA